jgi:hypothetical protein
MIATACSAQSWTLRRSMSADEKKVKKEQAEKPAPPSEDPRSYQDAPEKPDETTVAQVELSD